MQENKCGICVALEDCEKKTSNLYNIKLQESKNYVVMPAIGPLILGHVMIVSKIHFNNLASMGNAAIIEYDQLIEKIRKKIPLYKTKLLEIEHGATETDNAGACIVHAHIHLIPNYGEYEEIFIDTLNKITEIDKIQNIANVKKSYILVRGLSSNTKLYSATNLPSQFVRRVLFKLNDRIDWNWRIYL